MLYFIIIIRLTKETRRRVRRHESSQCHLQLHNCIIELYDNKIALPMEQITIVIWSVALPNFRRAAIAGVGGAQRLVLHDKEPKKTGFARNARGRTRSKNPLVLLDALI